MSRPFPWLRKKSDEPSENGRFVLSGLKIILREKRVDDAPDDYAWRTDQELADLDATRPVTMSYQEFLKYTKDELVFQSSSSQRLAIDTLDGRHIGNCMCYDINLRRGEAELGIMIGDREYWGRGYGTDSVETLLSHIFDAIPLNRVYLHTLEWNMRARRCFAKSGFRDVKNVRRGGMDFVLMEVLRAEWEGRQRERQATMSDTDQRNEAASD